MAIKIRPIVLKDAANFRRCYDAVAKERRYIIAYEAPPLSALRAELRNTLRANASFFVAVDGKRIIGWATVGRPQLGTLSHGGELGLVLQPEYRGTDVDKELAAKALKMSRGKVESVTFSCVGKDTYMLKLAMKMGFKLCGKLTKFVKMAYGFDDMLIMQKQLRR